MDENAKRDENRVPVTLCVNSVDRDNTLMLKVDPATGGVVVDLLGSAIAATQITPMPRDGNRITTLSFADSTNTTDSWAARTNTNNRLIVKFI